MNGVSYQEFLDNEARAEARRYGLARISVIFLLLFFSLQYAWEMSRGTWLEHAVIDQATVIPSAWAIDTVWPNQHVEAQGNRLVSPQARLNILAGCEGLESLFLLVAAFLAYPFTWQQRATGIAIGTLLIYVLNQVRIVILWHASIHDRGLFGLLHGTVLPLVLVATCLIFFLAFLSHHGHREA